MPPDPQPYLNFFRDGGPYVTVAGSFFVMGFAFLRWAVIPLIRTIAPVIADLRIIAESSKEGQKISQETIKQAKELMILFGRILDRNRRKKQDDQPDDDTK